MVDSLRAQKSWPYYTHKYRSYQGIRQEERQQLMDESTWEGDDKCVYHLWYS